MKQNSDNKKTICFLNSVRGEELYQALYQIGLTDIDRLIGIKLILQAVFLKLTKGDNNAN